MTGGILTAAVLAGLVLNAARCRPPVRRNEDPAGALSSVNAGSRAE